MSTVDCEEYSKEFPLSDDIIYLNHAAVSPWPLRTANAIKKFTEENLIYGASHYPDWINTETALRNQIRQLINAPSLDDIALLKNTSEALSVVAYGINWNKGDEIIITNQEFPSNRIVWESLHSKGVKVRPVNITDAETPEKAIINAITPATRLVSVSSVQYASGLRLNLKPVGLACKSNGVLFCVDAIQSLGAFEMDVQKIHADFIMADGHKWLMSPEGLAIFYVSGSVRNQLKLHQFGWHMVEALGDYDYRSWQPAHSARRFECGSPNMIGIHAMHASLSLFEEIGINKVQERVLDKVTYIHNSLQNSENLTLVYNYSEQYNSGIITFKHKTINNNQLHFYLTNKKIICAIRGGGIRFSPHFYTPKEKIRQALQLAEEMKCL